MKVSEWTPDIEEYVQSVARDAAYNKQVHLSLADQARKKYHYLMVCGMVVGPSSGLCSGVMNIFEDASRRERLFSITAVVLGILSGVAAAVTKFGKYNELADAHKQAAGYYLTLETSAVHQMNMVPSQRADVYDYLEWLQTNYADILVEAPLIPSHLRKKHIVDTRDTVITPPDSSWTLRRFCPCIPSACDTTDHVSVTIDDCDSSQVEYRTPKLLTSAYEYPTSTVQRTTSRPPSELQETTTPTPRVMSITPNDKLLEYELSRMMRKNIATS